MLFTAVILSVGQLGTVSLPPPQQPPPGSYYGPHYHGYYQQPPPPPQADIYRPVLPDDETEDTADAAQRPIVNLPPAVTCPVRLYKLQYDY